MSFNYPEFLSSNDGVPSSNSTNGARKLSTASANAVSSPTQLPNLFDKLSLDQQNPHAQAQLPSDFFGSVDSKLSNISTDSPTNDYWKQSFKQSFSDTFNKDSFLLPLELQGGIGTISSRRPSYAAESFTRSPLSPPGLSSLNDTNATSSNPQSGNSSKNLASYAMMNNLNQYVPQFDPVSEISLNSNFYDFQARRPSQLVDFNQQQYGYPQVFQVDNPNPNSQLNQFNPVVQQQQLQQQQQFQQPQQYQQPQQNQQNQHQHPLLRSHQQQSSHSQQLPSKNQYVSQSMNSNVSGYKQQIKLENGLILKDQYIIASPELKALYGKTMKYFEDPKITADIYQKLNSLLNEQPIIKLITFIKNLNNLTFNHKILCLVINKNGKFDLLSYPNNSNIFLQKDDLVIVDGDRGKDLVMIVEPLINLNFAILFNFLKKLEHLKSLTIIDSNNKNGTHSTSLNALKIINLHSNEDNEFIITLPTKQVLRFATPKEIHKILGKFLEEKKAFITCFNKIKELNLQYDLTLINVEYQSDFKKLIFYYFANFKRIDFRGLIKELFKIYKTRIWLCAVLPWDKPELYTTLESNQKRDDKKDEKPSNNNLIPKEYDLSNEQILNFSISEFENLAEPNYFHSINLLNLINNLTEDIKGHFYGFNDNFNTTNATANAKNFKNAEKFVPTFSPFDDNELFKPKLQSEK